MPRGNPEILRAAAKAKTERATTRAEAAIKELVRRRETINFRAVATAAHVSPDFLYNHPELRSRITQLRGSATPRMERPADSTSNVAAALTARLADQQRRNREEVQRLQAELAAAHGEILSLRRRLDARGG